MGYSVSVLQPSRFESGRYILQTDVKPGNNSELSGKCTAQ